MFALQILLNFLTELLRSLKYKQVTEEAVTWNWSDFAKNYKYLCFCELHCQADVLKNCSNWSASKYSIKTKAIKHKNVYREKQIEFVVNKCT